MNGAEINKRQSMGIKVPGHGHGTGAAGRKTRFIRDKNREL